MNSEVQCSRQLKLEAEPIEGLRLATGLGEFVFDGLRSGEVRRILSFREFRPAVVPEVFSKDSCKVKIIRSPTERFPPVRTEDSLNYEIVIGESDDSLLMNGGGVHIDGLIGRRSSLIVEVDEYQETSLFINHLQNAFRILTASKLPRVGSLMIHSAGIVMDGEAYIFIGHSGAGKSTLSMMSREFGGKILSDDINILALQDGGIVALESPFYGEYDLADHESQGTAYPVAGLFCLEKAEKLKVDPISKAALMAKLVGNTPYLNKEEEWAEVILDVAGKMVKQAACGRLTFSKTCNPWPALQAFVRRRAAND